MEDRHQAERAVVGDIDQVGLGEDSRLVEDIRRVDLAA